MTTNGEVHIWEKIRETEPGRLSQFLRELHYQHSGLAIKVDDAKRLMDCADYLERLAIAEVKKQIPPWVDELKAK